MSNKKRHNWNLNGRKKSTLLKNIVWFNLFTEKAEHGKQEEKKQTPNSCPPTNLSSC